MHGLNLVYDVINDLKYLIRDLEDRLDVIEKLLEPSKNKKEEQNDEN